MFGIFKKKEKEFGAVIREWDNHTTTIEIFSDPCKVFRGQKLKGICKPEIIYTIGAINWVKGKFVNISTIPKIENYVYNEALCQIGDE
jgi:hypothetical protein